MSFLSMFGTAGIKEKILSTFVQQYKEAGIKKLVLELDANDQIKTEVLTDNHFIFNLETHQAVPHDEYAFLLKFYNDHKPKI